MIREQITIKNVHGLHTRAAAKLVDIAKKFQSRIELSYQDRIVDCKSIMGLITLGAQKDNIIEIAINGADEKAALDAITHLINNRFDERE